jgi:hypothetical protein
MAQQQLVGIGSGELPNFPWDPGIHLVGSLLHLMMVWVAPASNILHSWIVLRGLAWDLFYMARQFSLLILTIEYGGGFADFGSTGIPLQVRLLDSRPNPYRYFSMRIQEWGIQYVYVGQTNHDQSGAAST